MAKKDFDQLVDIVKDYQDNLKTALSLPSNFVVFDPEWVNEDDFPIKASGFTRNPASEHNLPFVDLRIFPPHKIKRINLPLGSESVSIATPFPRGFISEEREIEKADCNYRLRFVYNNFVYVLHVSQEGEIYNNFNRSC
jgi:hypothetical protein